MVQAILIGTVTAMLVSGLLVINFLDYPYRPGSGSLKPTAMNQTLRQMDRTASVLHLEIPELCDAQGAPLGSDAAGN